MSAAQQKRTAVVLDAPYAKVHVERRDMPDHIVMRAKQLAELLVLMQPPEGPGNMLWLAQQLADELASVTWEMVTGGGAA